MKRIIIAVISLVILCSNPILALCEQKGQSAKRPAETNDVLNWSSFADLSKRLSDLMTLREKGDAEAIEKIKEIYRSARATVLIRAAAEKGDPVAQYHMGRMNSGTEVGIHDNPAEAVKWLRRAAEQGYARAQNNLAVKYRDGRGVEKDYVKSIKWRRKAAEQSYSRAQWGLGYMYKMGLGVKQDYAEAAKWYEKAIDQECPGAMNALGYMLAEQGKDLDPAEKLIRKALKIQPGNAYILDSLAWVLFKKGSPEKALPHVEKAVELKPIKAHLEHLGDILSALGRKEEAAAAYQKALAQEPSNKELKHKLDKVRGK